MRLQLMAFMLCDFYYESGYNDGYGNQERDR